MMVASPSARCGLAGLLIILAACDAIPPPVPDETAGTSDDRIECRLGHARRFERICRAERSPAAGGDIIVVRGPDGGFRRLRLTRDGRGVEAADGAEPAIVKIIDDGFISVDLGDDSFRLPARIAP